MAPSGLPEASNIEAWRYSQRIGAAKNSNTANPGQFVDYFCRYGGAHLRYLSYEQRRTVQKDCGFNCNQLSCTDCVYCRLQLP